MRAPVELADEDVRGVERSSNSQREVGDRAAVRDRERARSASGAGGQRVEVVEDALLDADRALEPVEAVDLPGREDEQDDEQQRRSPAPTRGARAGGERGAGEHARERGR